MKKNTFFKALVILIIFVLCIGYTIKTFQNDTFYTIKIGEDIMKYGVDMKDHFSFHGLVYTYPHWLYDVCIYIIYSFSGFIGIYISNIILYFVIGILLFVFNERISKNVFVSAVYTIISIIMIPQFITARAQVVTYIFFILEMYFIEKYLETNKVKFLIGLPILSLLIVNMHCAVWVFFFILFLPCIVERLLDIYKEKEIILKKIKKPKGKFLPCKTKLNVFNGRFYFDSKNIKYLFITMLLCILMGFLTLNGTTPFTYLINTMKGSTTTWIGEHLPPVLYYNKNLIFMILLFIFIAFIKIKIRIRDLFLLLGLFILAISSYRHISLLIICGSFSFVRIISDWIEETNKDITDLFILIFNKKVIAILFLILFSMLSFSNYVNTKIYKQNYVDELVYPIKASDYILKNLNLNKIKLYNQYNYGSYLLFRGIPVFIDSRADLYTKEFSGLDRDITVDFNNTLLNYEEIFEYYDITHVICYRYDEEFHKSALYEILTLNNSYSTIYEDEYFAIFEKE